MITAESYTFVTSGTSLSNLQKNGKATVSSEVQQHWEKLFLKLERLLQLKDAEVTSEDKEGLCMLEDSYKSIVFALDELLDELKSGEILYDPRRMLHCLLNGPLQFKNNWQMIQNGLYAFPYVFTFLQESLEAFLSTDVDFVYSKIIKFLKDEKRELREAAAWAFGSVAELIGNKIFTFFSKELLTTKQSKDTRELEGFQVAVGFTVRSCKDISYENFAFCLDYLLPFMFLDLSDTHRNAVRVQSIKAVERCISEIHGQLLVLKNTDENLTWHARLAESARKLLSDEEITVRRAAASLLNCLLSVPNTETGIADHVEMLLDDLSQATTWVHRHGINMTMHLLCLDTVKVLRLEGLLDRLLESMQVQNRHTHPGVPRRTAVTICGPANAEAGSAIVALYKSLWQLGHPRAHTLYQSVVHAELLALLESPIPHCQDAGGACFNFLLNMDCLSEQQKLELLVHSYQNNYGHGAVAQSNSRNWDFVLEEKKKAGVSPDEFVASVAPLLLSWISQDGHLNSELIDVRESYFRALAELFRSVEQSLFVSLPTPGYVLESIIAGCKNTDEDGSEYARVEAWKALHAFFILCARTCSEEVIIALADNFVELAAEGLCDEENAVVGSVLKAICSLKISGLDRDIPLLPLLGPILLLTYTRGENKFDAILTTSCVFGNHKSLIATYPHYVSILFEGLKDRFNLGMDGDSDIEPEIIEAVAKLLCDLSQIKFTSSEGRHVLLVNCLRVLLGNYQQLGVRTHCLSALCNLLCIEVHPPLTAYILRCLLCVILGSMDSLPTDFLDNPNVIDYKHLDQQLLSKNSIEELNEPFYAPQLLLCAESLRRISLWLNTSEHSLGSSVLSSIFRELRGVTNGAFAVWAVSRKLADFFGTAIEDDFLVDLLEEWGLANHYYSPLSDSFSQVLKTAMKETEMPDKGDVQSQVTERLRIYFVAETLRRTLAAGYRPTPENIYLDIPKLVHLEEVDAENESNSFFLLEKELEALPCHQLDIFSIEAPLNALEKLTHACMEKFEESDVKQLSDSILVHLGLIKSEERIRIADKTICGLAKVATWVVRHPLFSTLSMKATVALLIKLVRSTGTYRKRARMTSYICLLRLLDTCFQCINEGISPSLRRSWYEDLIIIGAKQWHRKLRNGATIQLTAAIVRLVTKTPALHDQVATVCQLIVDSAANDDLQELRDPLFEVTQALASCAPTLLKYPEPTPLLSVKDNCTFVQNQEHAE
ncbi:uncharacterized protein LOC135121305 isoform X2 [Zophobas morio]|uniref:uncharacterized protein LOC135121305 isoform X2 n=1 Tax=Zophobas morio TaxID=2755281 RepID=UPI003083D477